MTLRDDAYFAVDWDGKKPAPTAAATAPADGFIIEIEQHFLGALLSGGDHAKALAIMSPETFVEPVHGDVFRLIETARATYGTTKLPVVAKMLSPDLIKAFELGTGEQIGPYLARCVANTLHSPASSVQGARAVLQQWARVSAGREAALVADATRDPSADALEVMRSAARSFDDIASRLRVGSRARSQVAFAEAASDALAEAREARRRGGLVGLTTGLVDLDRLMGGLQRRDLILAAARPAMGKTTLGTSVSRAVAETGVGVAFISLEMDARKLAARMVSDIAHQNGFRVPYQDLITGAAAEADLEVLEDAIQHYRELPLVIEDQTALTVSEIRAKVEGMLEKAEAAGKPVGLVVIDHLHKIRPSSRYSGNRANEVSEITDALKAMAREHDVAVLLLAQLNRGVEGRDDKRPQLMDLRDSGAIEQDADVVLFLYRAAYYIERARPDDAGMDRLADWHASLDKERQHLEVLIAKQRNGPIANVDLHIDIACSAIRNAARVGQYREAA